MRTTHESLYTSNIRVVIAALAWLVMSIVLAPASLAQREEHKGHGGGADHARSSSESHGGGGHAARASGGSHHSARSSGGASRGRSHSHGGRASSGHVSHRAATTHRRSGFASVRTHGGRVSHRAAAHLHNQRVRTAHRAAVLHATRAANAVAHARRTRAAASHAAALRNRRAATGATAQVNRRARAQALSGYRAPRASTRGGALVPGRASALSAPAVRSWNTADRVRQQRRVDPVTWSHDGRSFRRGVGIDPAYAVASPGLNVYFVDGWACYPHYCPTFAVGLAFYSPFWCYSDVCAPCIYSQFCFVAPPPFVFVDIPIYVGGVCRGWQSESHEYYLAEGYYVERGSAMDSGLRVCVGDIEHAFRVGDIVRLSDHVDPGVKIAVYIRGRYSYSIGCNDYLDMTRDAMRSMDTVRFGLTSIRRRGHGVYVCSGKHIYRNRAGQIRTVYISFAVKSYAGRWVITQVCTAPDRL